MSLIINLNFAITLKHRLRGSQLEKRLATAGFVVQTRGAQNPVITATAVGQTIYFQEASTHAWVDSISRNGRYAAIGVAIGFDYAAKRLFDGWLEDNPEDWPEHLPEEKDPRDRSFTGTPFPDSSRKVPLR